jgi:hypothetical protein
MNIIRWDGSKISEPGIYVGIDMKSYHGDLCVGPSISSSGLRKIFNNSLEEYFDSSYLNPNRDEDDDNQNFIFGRACHFLLLGEARFKDHFVVRPEKIGAQAWNGNATVCKEWLAHCEGLGLTVLKPADILAIRGMAEGLQKNALVKQGILNGLIEHSIIYRDEETGIWVKCRPDSIPTDALDCSDLKSMADVSDASIDKSIGDYLYNVQGALVGQAFRAVVGREMSSFSLVCSRKTRPFSARVKTLKPADLELGEQIIHASLRLFADALASGKWPGPGGEQTDASYAEITPWRRRDIEYRLELLKMGQTP